MQYHLLLTERCNLNCTYCGGTRHVKGIPLDPSYEFSDLKSFIAKDPEPVIGFYGGEPLLNLDYMYKIMDNIPAKAHTLQTNAIHLSEIDDDHLHRLHSILVSVDGCREVTDHYRGSGTYERVMENLRNVKRRGYKGDVVARMAFSDYGDIYRDVTYLLNLEDPHFNHVHWQLDVFWSDLETRGDLQSWLKRYEIGISRLVHDFCENMKNGRILGVVPFIPVLKTLLTGEPTPHIRCGSGSTSFSIMTSGRIDVCPIAPELTYSTVGDIHTSKPQDLKDSLKPGHPCDSCDDLWICGGRCLFANQTMYWGRPWFDRICETTRQMIRELEKLVPLVSRLMDEKVIQETALDYPEVNNGCEIIP